MSSSARLPLTVPECRDCGVCCREAASDGRILVSEHDLVRWRREGARHILTQLVPGHFGEMAFAATAAGACVHHGAPGRPNDCSIYDTRAEVCRLVERGGAECLAYLRGAKAPAVGRPMSQE